MHHPYEKFARIELFAIGIALLIGIFALFKGILLFILLSFYLIMVSLVSGALIEWSVHRTEHAIKHALQAVLLFIFTTYLLFHL